MTLILFLISVDSHVETRVEGSEKAWKKGRII